MTRDAALRIESAAGVLRMLATCNSRMLETICRLFLTVIDLLQQEFLLLDLGFQRTLGLLQLATFMQASQVFQFRKEPGAHIAPCRFRVLEQEARQFLADAEEKGRWARRTAERITPP
jgi:hypothetical protein